MHTHTRSSTVAADRASGKFNVLGAGSLPQRIPHQSAKARQQKKGPHHLGYKYPARHTSRCPRGRAKARVCGTRSSAMRHCRFRDGGKARVRAPGGAAAVARHQKRRRSGVSPSGRARMQKRARRLVDIEWHGMEKLNTACKQDRFVHCLRSCSTPAR